ncbi:MAG: hypothetical protein HXY25_09165 [Alphaproteobacteria bacterium]|nr:hypothetical protein [Alphaproteobacteria bacterium]
MGRHGLAACLLSLCLMAGPPAMAADAETDPARLAEILRSSDFAPDDATLAWLVSSDHEGPFHMVNLLKFNETAAYPEGSEFGGTGREAQARYSAAMRGVTADNGVRSMIANPVIGPVITHGALSDEVTDWDVITVVFYPSRQAVISMVQDPRYKAAIVHKNAALARTVAFVTLPGGAIVTPPAPAP